MDGGGTIQNGKERDKMTYKEAKNKIWYEQCALHCDHDDCDTCIYDFALSAIEKQIPEKPIQDETAENIYYCPKCTKFFNGYRKPHNCKCGQALKWGDE